MALYLYCVRERTFVRPFYCKGMWGNEGVFAIACKDLTAVVSTVPSRIFREEEITRKALQDIAWITNKAKRHEAVLEEAMGPNKRQPVIPFKFGTIFKNRGHVLASIASYHDQFLSTLKKLDGKQEWHCKVYLRDPKGLENDIRLTNHKIQTQETRMRSMNEGAAYFVHLQIEKDIEQEKRRRLTRFGEYIFRTLNRQAEDAAHGKILEKELTGRPEPMIVNGIFLFQDAKISESQKTVEQLAKKFPIFDFAYTGPWPPYNFV